MKRNNTVISPFPVDELLSILPTKNIRERNNNTTSTRFLLRIKNKSSWMRTTIDYVVVCDAFPHESGSKVSFQIAPGVSSILSIAIWTISLIYSIIKICFLKTYVVERYGFTFIGILLLANIALFVFYYKGKIETKEKFIKIVSTNRNTGDG